MGNFFLFYMNYLHQLSLKLNYPVHVRQPQSQKCCHLMFQLKYHQIENTSGFLLVLIKIPLKIYNPSNTTTNLEENAITHLLQNQTMFKLLFVLHNLNFST